MNQRLSDINYDYLISVGNRALIEYHKTVLNTNPDVSIVGVVVVGSVLTDDFDRRKSDLDLYFVTNEEYEDDGFWRMINDSETIFQQDLSNHIGDEFVSVDCNGTVAESNIDSKIRNPSMTYIQ